MATDTEHDVLSDLMRASLDHCVKCTICESSCPVAAATPLFPGPKYVGPQAERFRVAGEESPDSSLDYCSGCGICTQVCPQGVHVAEINSQARAHLRERTGFRLRDRLIARPHLTGRLGTVAAPLANRTLASRPARLAAERVLGLDRQAALPHFATRTFQRWAKDHRSPPAARHVAYFHGCGVNWYEPRLGEMAVALLEHVGCDVAIPTGQACCGLPLQSNGMFAAARRTVRRMARRLAPAARSGRVLVGTSTSCTLMLKREAREILTLEADPHLRLVGDAMNDICEYLLALHDEEDLGPRFTTPVPLTVTYHAPCQQQGHGIGKPALDLLALVPELRVVEHDVACCGIAGTYGLKHEKHQIAVDVGAPLWRQVAAAEPDLVVCDSETCRWHIAQITGVPSVHPVELLYRAAGLA